MHDAAVAIEDVRPVLVRLARVEGEEVLRRGDGGIACGGDRLEQIERAAEFLVEDRAGQVVAALRAAAEKEPAAQPLVRLVDRDVRPGHPRVPDEKRGRGQSAKPATDDVRFHRSPPSGTSGRSSRFEVAQASEGCSLAKSQTFPRWRLPLSGVQSGGQELDRPGSARRLLDEANQVISG